MGDCLEKLAYEMAYAQLRGQKDDLRYFRNQATAGAIFSGIVAGMFARLASASEHTEEALGLNAFLGISVEYWLVFLTFGGSIIAAVVAIINWSKVKFELDPNSILFAVDNGESQEILYRRLACDANRFFDENESVVGSTRQALWWSLVLAAGQMPAWLLVIY